MIRKVSDMQIGKSLIKNNGKISEVAKELGLHVNTVRKRLKNSPRIQSRLEDAEEKMLDLAVQVVVDKMGEGNLKAAQYYLDNKGKRIGFGAKQPEIVNNDDNNAGMMFNLLDTTEMDVSVKKLLLESLINQQKKQLEEGTK